MLFKIFKRYFVLIGLPIFLWQCYWYVGFNQNLTKIIDWVLSFILLVVFAERLFKNRKNVYNQYISYIIVFYLISIIMALLYWGQSPMLTYRASTGPLVMLYFFVLQKMKVSEQELLRIITIFAGIYILLWLYALSQAPRTIFGNLEEVHDDRGFYRILQLRSIDTVCLLYFVSLVQFIKKSYKIKWLIVCIVCFVVIFLALSRMLILALIIVSVFFILRKKLIHAFVWGIVLTLGFERLSQNELVYGMVDMTESQIQQNDDDKLRLTEYKNMFSAYPFNVGTMFFGNGSAHTQSEYGKYDEKLKKNRGFNRSDSGYVGIFVTHGITMLILLLVMLFHIAWLKVPIDYQPFRLFVFFLFINNIANYSFWGYGISFAIALYALSIAEEKQKIARLQNQINIYMEALEDSKVSKYKLL